MSATPDLFTWNDWDFHTNLPAIDTDTWHDLLTWEVPQNEVIKFFAGRPIRLKFPTAEQDTAVDANTPTSYTFSLAHSIGAINGPDLDYQVQAFADGTELPVTGIDTTANEVTIDTSSDPGASVDITVFYLPDNSDQMVRLIVRATNNAYDYFKRDDMGVIHQLDQRNTEQQIRLANNAYGPEFFYAVIQVKSSIEYITDPSQSSSLNNYAIETDIKQAQVPYKKQTMADYLSLPNTPGTRAGVKDAVISQLNA